MFEDKTPKYESLNVRALPNGGYVIEATADMYRGGTSPYREAVSTQVEMLNRIKFYIEDNGGEV